MKIFHLKSIIDNALASKGVNEQSEVSIKVDSYNKIFINISLGTDTIEYYLCGEKILRKDIKHHFLKESDHYENA